jgi:hypothetical protein
MSSKTTVLRALAALCVLSVLAGCGVEPEPAKPSSVSAIRKRTLERIDKLEKQVAENRMPLYGPRELATSLEFLEGHMKAVGVGTEEQLAQLNALTTRVYELSYQMPRTPPGEALIAAEKGETPKDFAYDTMKFKDILPEARKVVEGLPDSPLAPTRKAR